MDELPPQKKAGDYKIMKTPVNYHLENVYNSARSPSTVHCQNTALVRYYAKYLLEKVISVFEFSGIPEDWPLNYFQYTLFGYGHIAILDNEKYGLICQDCHPYGFDLYYQPSHVTIANPLIVDKNIYKIGEECELIKLQPNYTGVMDIVTTYADLMALCLETAGINLLNSKLSFVFFAENRTMAEGFKKTYDKYASGEPMMVIDKNMRAADGSPTWEAFTQNVGQNYIVGNVLDDMKKIVDQFNTDIGIPNANTYKRERMITDEVNANNIDTQSKIALWLETMRRDIAKVNSRYGLNIAVRYRFDKEAEEVMEVDENAA